MGIICKTHRQAERVHEALREHVPDVHLLTSRSTAFVRGVVVCAAHLAKGLEFDQVLVPHATDDNYTTALDRNLLYVACTRAMHHLVVTHAGTLTRFVRYVALRSRCASYGDLSFEKRTSRLIRKSEPFAAIGFTYESGRVRGARSLRWPDLVGGLRRRGGVRWCV